MTITILTLFPEIFKKVLSASILLRAQKKGLLTIRVVNIRDYATDKHKTVDDKPYGGGVGMLLRVDIVERAIAKSKISAKGRSASGGKINEKVVLLDPAGELFSQSKAGSYARLDHLMLICGHYEGIDQRIHHFVDERISIGNYILTGGEIPSMVIADAVTRLIPNVLAKKEAVAVESHTGDILKEAPQYTRPEIFKGLKVPSVLLSGDHKRIALWRKKHTLKKD